MESKTDQPTKPISRVAARLIAHARLCRQLAAASIDENTAEKLRLMAEICDRDASDIHAAETATQEKCSKMELKAAANY